MGALKIVGGILALAGAGLIIVLQILWLIDVGFSTGLLYTLILPILALIGAILALAGKRAGGIIALIVGIIWLTVAILLNLDVLTFANEIILIFVQYPLYSFFYMYLGFHIWGFLTIETILVLIGGLLATAGGSD